MHECGPSVAIEVHDANANADRTIEDVARARGVVREIALERLRAFGQRRFRFVGDQPRSDIDACSRSGDERQPWRGRSRVGRSAEKRERAQGGGEGRSSGLVRRAHHLYRYRPIR